MPTFKTNLSALNAILAASGEQPEITEVRAWKKIQEATLLNQNLTGFEDWYLVTKETHEPIIL